MSGVSCTVELRLNKKKSITSEPRFGMNDLRFMSCQTCLKRPLLKRTNFGFQTQLSFSAGQREHSVILSTFIKLPFTIKISVVSIFEWPFNTGFTVQIFYTTYLIMFTELTVVI